MPHPSSLRHSAPRGQALIQYAALIAAVALAVSFVAKFVYNSFSGSAERLEDEATAF